MTTPGERNFTATVLKRMLGIDSDEVRPVLLSFGYFFSLLCAYYVLRPVRDEMGILGGVDNLQWLFTGTFVVMLLAVPVFGWAASRFRRRVLLPAVYLFFIFNLLMFFSLFSSETAPVWTARAFFIWLSVFNLMVVSVFWSFMSDLYTSAQGKRLFGLIAAGGSAGAISGPSLTALLAPRLGTANLMLVSAVFLALALVCVLSLLRDRRAVADATHDAPLQGSVWAGLNLTLSSRYLLGIAAFIWLYTTLSTFLYFEQAHIVKEAFTDSAERTRVFALIDLAVNGLTILIQLFVAGRLMQYFGISAALSAVPLILAAGLAWLAMTPVLAALVATQIVRRAGNYALTKPGREALFTAVSREERYKAKNFIDTVVYRGGDAVSGWLFAGFKAMGLGLSAIAWIAVPIALVWALIGYRLGVMHGQRASGEK